jgi:hypothetical protein
MTKNREAWLSFIHMVTSHELLLTNRTCTKLIIGYDNKTNVPYELNFLAYKLVTWTEYITAQHVLLWGQSRHLWKYILSRIKGCVTNVSSKFDDWIYWTSLLQLHLVITVHTLSSLLITNLSLYFFWVSDWSLSSTLLLLSMTDSMLCQSESESRVANQFILAPSPLRLATRFPPPSEH